MPDGSELRKVRLAENQSAYRNVNERIETLNEVFTQVGSFEGEWICECADTECTTRIQATMAEYEAVRANPRTFIVASGHVFSEVENIVQANERFTVVEKLGVAGEVAEANDPRTDPALQANSSR